MHKSLKITLFGIIVMLIGVGAMALTGYSWVTAAGAIALGVGALIALYGIFRRE